MVEFGKLQFPINGVNTNSSTNIPAEITRWHESWPAPTLNHASANYTSSFALIGSSIVVRVLDIWLGIPQLLARVYDLVFAARNRCVEVDVHELHDIPVFS